MKLIANLWRRRPRRMLRIVAMESDAGIFVVVRGELSGKAACGLALRLLAPLQQHARPNDDHELHRPARMAFRQQAGDRSRQRKILED